MDQSSVNSHNGDTVVVAAASDTANEDDDGNFTFTPPLRNEEQIVFKERMAIIGEHIEINDLDDVDKNCDTISKHKIDSFQNNSASNSHKNRHHNDVDHDHHHVWQCDEHSRNHNSQPIFMDDGLSNLENNTNTNNMNQKNDTHHNDYERFSQWIYCIAVVNFDIEIGQSIECIFPENVQLTEKEISNICYLSFPDSNSGCMGDTQFYFRTKSCPIERPYFDRFYKEFNSKCLSLLEIEKSFFYGFVYFRQVKDRGARRGYFQKSLVILTWFPFVSLFSRIMKILAPQFFDYGLPSLEAASSDINRWPPPITDQILKLPLFGTIIQVLIPGEKHSSSMCQMTSSSSSSINLVKKYTPSSLSLKSLSLLKLSQKFKTNHVYESSSSSSSSSSASSSATIKNNNNNTNNNSLELCSTSIQSSIMNVANDINIYKILMPIIAHIQLLWELVLTNEPIAVIAQTPNVCSDIVTSLVHLIAPLKYGADHRPFFTIHDSEFKEYTSHSKSPPPVILGVTNPFFVKTLQEWPHLIKINEIIIPKHSGSKKVVNIDASVKNNSNKTLEMKTGVYTKYKPFLQKDREILKKLLKGIELGRPSEVQNAIIRRFLIELTQSFSIPLERYFASLMPLAKNLSPFKRPPILHHFKIDEFINSLDATGPHLTSVVKGDWTGLYRRFLRSPNFVCWYNTRMQEANNKIMSLHLETICNSDLFNLLDDKPEIEIVDLILKLKEYLKCVNDGEMVVSVETTERLRFHIDKIIKKLPEDSRVLFENNFRTK